MVLVDIASTILTTYTALATSIVAVVGVGLKWLASRNHSPRLAVAETDIEHIKSILGEVTADKDKILKGVAVADVVVPQLSQAAAEHAKQITDMNVALADITAKVNLIGSVVPVTAKLPTTTEVK